MLSIIKHLDSIRTDIPVSLLDYSSCLRPQGHNMTTVASYLTSGIKVEKRRNDSISFHYFTIPFVRKDKSSPEAHK